MVKQINQMFYDSIYYKKNVLLYASSSQANVFKNVSIYSYEKGTKCIQVKI